MWIGVQKPTHDKLFGCPGLIVWVVTSLQMRESENNKIAAAKIAELEKCMLQIGERSMTGWKKSVEVFF